ncbi:MAG: Gfo/Idh/MocA family protein [Spirochaetaceae bacterium]
MRRYRIGILGYGFIGRVHAWAHENLRFHYRLPFETEIARVATSHAETAERAAGELGAEWTVESTAITRAEDIDVVHVCTPNHLHHEALLEAISAGKHIYCDKPLVVTADEAADIRRAVEEQRRNAGSSPAFGMTFHNRFFPATLHARRLVEQGFLGIPLSYRAAYLHSGSADPEAPLTWKLSARAGGGVLRDLASHALDLVSRLLGEYTEVRAVTDIAYAERPDPADASLRRTVDAEDNALVIAHILPSVSPEHRREPIPGVIEASKIATGSEDELRVEIHGSLGSVRFNTMDPHHLEIYDRRDAPYRGAAPGGWTRLQTGGRYPEPARDFPSPKNSIGWLRAHLACIASFMQHVHAGTQPDPGLADGLYMQQVIDAVERAAQSGTAVQL